MSLNWNENNLKIISVQDLLNDNIFKIYTVQWKLYTNISMLHVPAYLHLYTLDTVRAT